MPTFADTDAETETTMNIDFVDLNDSVRSISLSGRMDILGTDTIATKFAALSTTANRRVIVDLTQVDFLASIGIRALISNAKSLQQRGGKMVLFVGANDIVSKTLQTTGIDALIPMFGDMDEARSSAES
jgi:anti-anti-sigma factor